MVIVYQHRRLDTNEIFYIGIGKKEKRAFSKYNRNKYWKNIVNKVDYIVEILYSNISRDEACCIEKELINYYGRKDLGKGNLVNMTDGGEGVHGLILKVSDETKLKISNSMKGRVVSEETRKKLSLINIGNQNCKGRINSNETNKRISLGKLGRKKRGKPVIDLNTNIIYQSISEVSEKFNIKNRTLAGYLDGSRKNKTSFKYFEEPNNNILC